MYKWNPFSGTFDNINSATPTWTKYTVSHTALQTAATTNNILLFTAAAKQLVTGVVLKHSTAFAGGTISAYTISIGIGSNLTKFSSTFDVFQAVSETATQSTLQQQMSAFGSTTPVQISAVSTGANLSASTQGSIDVWVSTVQLA